MTAERMRARLAVPVTFWGRFRLADPGLMAAAVAFNAFFALVPTMFALFTAASLVGADASARRAVEDALEALVPNDLVEFIIGVLDDIVDVVAGQEGAIIGVSVLVALWSGSRGVHALQKALARIEQHEEDRPRWRVRLIGVALTAGAGLSLVLVSVFVVLGGGVVKFLSQLTGWQGLEQLRLVLGLPAAALGLYLVLYAVYRWGPPEPIAGAGWAALGSTVAAVLTSAGYSVYLSRLAASPLGVLGALGLALLWLQVTAYVLLLVAAAVGFGWRRRRANADPSPPG
jgi:membrane protein